MSSQPPPPPPNPYDPMDPSEPQQPDPNPSPPTGEWQQGPPPQQGAPPQQGPPPQQYGAPGSSMNPSEEKTWAILAHLSAPIATLVSVGTLNFVGPLIIWAIYKDRSPKVRHASAGAFNFNLSLWILYAALFLVTILTLGVGLLITLPVGLVVWIGSMVLHIMAAVKASNGEVYTYPLQIPVLK